MKIIRLLIVVVSIFSIFSLPSCKKEEILKDGSVKLRFSEDTLLYDTVFVTIGSITKNLKVYNNYSQPISISSIRLAGGSSSNFRMNVNGLPGSNFSNIEIRSGDSLWIFVEVTVDQNNQNLPFIIKDSIIFETNGNVQDVDLVAWGQNAHFFVASQQNVNLPPYVLIDTSLNATSVWNDSLPYVIYGGYAVVDSSNTLIINPGTQIHCSNGGGLWVYKGGTLKVQGTKAKPVVFQGLRREQSYQDEPGQWDRIWINDGGVNEIDYAIIKNAFIGLQCETLFAPAMPVSLKVTNTIIKNMSGVGILARNFKIDGWNDLVGNCGQYATAFTIGGSYDFRQCTFANYWNANQRGTPAFYMNNYTTDANNMDVPVALTRANFFNCIITGNNDNEFEVDMKSGADSIYNFSNVLITANAKHPTNGSGYTKIFRNEDAKFKEVQKNDYSLDSLSFCIDKGDINLNNANPALSTDQQGNIRPQGAAPDLGALERQ
jgi:hypothetical protein